MRRFALVAAVMTGLWLLYGLSPIAAWISLAAAAVFVFTRRTGDGEAEPARAEY